MPLLEAVLFLLVMAELGLDHAIRQTPHHLSHRAVPLNAATAEQVPGVCGNIVGLAALAQMDEAIVALRALVPPPPLVAIFAVACRLAGGFKTRLAVLHLLGGTPCAG